MQEMLQETKQREFFYALLSRLFMKEIDSDFLQNIEHKDIKEFFPNLGNWEKYNTKDKNQLIESDFAVDFAEISLINLIPYETFYTRDDGMIESGGDNPVLQFYEEFEFVVEKDKARVLSPDHIGVELEFMYMLCNAQIKALEEGDAIAAKSFKDIQNDFLEKHLLNWAPLYFMQVKQEAQTPLYHDGAMLATEFLLSDYEYLKTGAIN